MSKRVKSKATVSDSDSSSEQEVEVKKKKAKPEKPKSSSSAKEDGFEFPLTNKRKVSVRQFKGKTMVDIREYYEDSNGDIKPGRKGISLQLDQWEKLKNLVGDIDEAIENFKG